jgi:hypothetical protein
MPMQDSTNAAVNERNCTIGSNSAAAPANHKTQLPTIVSFKFFTGMAVMVWDCTESMGHFLPT